MKKIILACLVIGICVLIATGCGAYNKQIMDLTYHFDRGIISLPNGEVVEGTVDSWKDYEDGDQLQVKINGKTYLTHATNVVLISE